MPQFIISAIASLIFFIVEPGVDHSIGGTIVGNDTLITDGDSANSTAAMLYSRSEASARGGANSYAIIFR